MLLSQLSRGGCPIEEVVRSMDDGTGALSVREQMSRLWRAGRLMQTISWQGEDVAALRARGEAPLIPYSVSSDDRITLTEDGCVHRNGATLVVEALNCGAVIEFKKFEYCAIVTGLMEVATCSCLAKRYGFPEEIVTALISWFLAIGVASCDRELETYPQWSFADRLLHARSRTERQIGGYGATFHQKGGPSLLPPALRPARDSKRLTLVRPDLAAVSGQEPPFTFVLENRCSMRDFDGMPLSLPELSEFLYRTARIRSTTTLGEAQYVTRPFPSAGGLHELEFYLIVNHCSGIPPACYRYDGLAHELEHVSDPTPESNRLLQDAAWSAAMKTQPQILIILAARFSRVNTKYESIAYSLVLKDVGVVYQTMYLVATAMGLASCALGGGSSAGFCRIAGTGYWEESSVGEFILGKRPHLKTGGIE